MTGRRPSEEDDRRPDTSLRPDEALQQPDTLTPFEYALAGIETPDGSRSPGRAVVDHMVRLLEVVGHAPVTQPRLQEFLDDGGSIGRRHDRRARGRPVWAAPTGSGSYVDITPPELVAPGDGDHRPTSAGVTADASPDPPAPTDSQHLLPFPPVEAGGGNGHPAPASSDVPVDRAAGTDGPPAPAGATGATMGLGNPSLVTGEIEVGGDPDPVPLRRPRRSVLALGLTTAAALIVVVGGAWWLGAAGPSGTATDDTSVVGPADRSDPTAMPATGEAEAGSTARPPSDPAVGRDGAASGTGAGGGGEDGPASSGAAVGDRAGAGQRDGTDPEADSTTPAERESAGSASDTATPGSPGSSPGGSTLHQGTVVVPPTPSTSGRPALGATDTASAATGGGSATLRGRVLLKGPGGPAASGTTVELRRDRSGRPGDRVASTAADASGRYRFPVESGCYHVVVRPGEGLQLRSGDELPPVCTGGGSPAPGEGTERPRPGATVSAPAVVVPDVVLVEGADAAPPSACVVDDRIGQDAGVTVYEPSGNRADTYRFYDTSGDAIADTGDLGPAGAVDGIDGREWRGEASGFDHRAVVSVAAVRGGVESAPIRCTRTS